MGHWQIKMSARDKQEANILFHQGRAHNLQFMGVFTLLSSRAVFLPVNSHSFSRAAVAYRTPTFAKPLPDSP